MNPLKKLVQSAGKFARTAVKWFTVPTISGGFEIFSGVNWDQSISKTKMMHLYGKSLYVYACVTKIAQKTASIDWELFRIKNRAGDKQQVFVHEALDLLYRPNPFQTKGEFFEKYIINKKLTGEAYILKVRSNGPGSKVTELWNLRPDMMTIVKDKELYIKGFEFNAGGKITFFSPDDIIFDASPNPVDEFGGMSPLAAANTRVETELNAVTYQRNFFKNNARPDFILKTDGKVSADQKEEIKESWDKRHKGATNAGKGAILEGGLSYQQISISQREMDYIESLRMTRDDILTAYGVPKPIVAVTDDVNLANAETAMRIFLSETIVPEIKRLTEKLNESLIYPEYGDVFYIDFVDPVPENRKEMAEVQQIMLASGTLLINEAREMLGLPPVAGGWTLYQPLSNVPVGGLSQNNAAKAYENEFGGRTDKSADPSVFRGRRFAYKYLEVEEEVRKEIMGTIEAAVLPSVTQSKQMQINKSEDGVKKIVPAEIRQVYADTMNKAIDKKGDAYKPAILKYGEEQQARVLSKLSKAKSVSEINTKALNGIFDVSDENKIFATISIPFITEFITDSGKEAVEMLNPAEEFSVTEKIQAYIKERAKETAKAVNDTTLEKLSRVLAEGIEAGEGIADLTDRVRGVYDEYPTYRAETIARTEATAANNRGLMEGYDQSGIANSKEWIATNDSRTRDSHSHADGEVVSLDDEFSNGLKYPGDPSADPAETINCRCVLAPAYRE